MRPLLSPLPPDLDTDLQFIVWVKRGICSADSFINIALCCLGYLPGLIHAWVCSTSIRPLLFAPANTFLSTSYHTTRMHPMSPFEKKNPECTSTTSKAAHHHLRPAQGLEHTAHLKPVTARLDPPNRRQRQGSTVNKATP
jgi:hypothetical protein